jgi:hypothetical protein
MKAIDMDLFVRHDGMNLMGVIMLKQVGASGQISLGKKFAGRQFNVVIHQDDRFELIPVRVVPMATAREPKIVHAPDGWVPPGGYDECTQWALDNRDALEHYSQQVEEAGTAAEQLQRYLDDDNPDVISVGHAKV